MKLVKCSEGDVKVVEGNKIAKNGNFSKLLISVYES